MFPMQLVQIWHHLQTCWEWERRQTTTWLVKVWEILIWAILSHLLCVNSRFGPGGGDQLLKALRWGKWYLSHFNEIDKSSFLFSSAFQHWKAISCQSTWMTQNFNKSQDQMGTYTTYKHQQTFSPQISQWQNSRNERFFFFFFYEAATMNWCTSLVWRKIC